MITPLHTIKLTSHISPREGYAAFPRFDPEVWSLLVAHAAEIEAVYLFANSFWRGDKRLFAAGGRVSPRITAMNSFADLTDKIRRELLRRTSGDGHLSVLYGARAAGELLPRLVNLYPRGRRIGDDSRDDLGLKEDETAEMRSFVRALAPEHVVVGFASGADPCYIFGGNTDALALILDCAALYAAPSVR